ncbi:hypothetical protein [Acrocarpospora macrocephala]|uniref:hypothetical protein n=1 Tax=Acrocarpospora macrocephala TaxID=150177 RepID=UPI0012D2AF62|nr:hypothetical protein [Acrocarpospora macrocephala]
MSASAMAAKPIVSVPAVTSRAVTAFGGVAASAPTASAAPSHICANPRVASRLCRTLIIKNHTQNN